MKRNEKLRCLITFLQLQWIHGIFSAYTKSNCFIRFVDLILFRLLLPFAMLHKSQNTRLHHKQYWNIEMEMQSSSYCAFSIFRGEIFDRRIASNYFNVQINDFFSLYETKIQIIFSFTHYKNYNINQLLYELLLHIHLSTVPLPQSLYTQNVK